MEYIRLIELAKQGFIPGPFETEDSFLKRVDYCIGLQKELEFDPTPTEILNEALPITESLFGIAPSWIPINFSNHQLPLWVGGCAWIFQKTEETPNGAFIQLRRSLKEKKSFCFYQRNELIAHELSHIGRMEFEEPRYEEIFAYQTSPSRLRKFLGPLFSQGWEMMLFMTFVVFVFLADLCALWWGGWESYIALFPLKLLPAGWFVLMLYKLTIKQLKFKKLKNRFPLKFLYGLTDREIDSFGKMSDREINLYAEKQDSLRWQYLKSL